MIGNMHVRYSVERERYWVTVFGQDGSPNPSSLYFGAYFDLDHVLNAITLLQPEHVSLRVNEHPEMTGPFDDDPQTT